MIQVKLSNPIAAVGLERLPAEQFTAAKDVESPDAILVRSANLHELDIQDNLLCIARAGAGVNNIPIDKCSQKGVVVFNTPGANANAVRELALCALFLSSRDIVGGINWAQSLTGDDVPAQVEKGKSAFVGPELRGKTLGVVGLGAIGVGLANAAHHLDMDVMGYDPYISVDAAWGLSRSVRKSANLAELFANSDYISLHVPLNKETRGMINEAVLAQMKPGVRILNLARGELVDNAALLKALDSGHVTAYVTDFPSQELLNVPNVIPIPHLGASTPESEDNCAVMAANELREYTLYGNITNSVNLPDVYLPVRQPKTGARLCVIHQNIPNILGTVAGIVSSAKINIENMLSKSKGELAYALLDTGDVPDDALVTRIRETEGILRVRLLL